MKNKKIVVGLVGGLSIFLINPYPNKITPQVKPKHYHPKVTFDQVAPKKTIEQPLLNSGEYADSELSNEDYQDWVNSNPVTRSINQAYQASDHYQEGLDKWRETKGKAFTADQYLATDRSTQSYARWWGTRPQKLHEHWQKSGHFKGRLAAFQEDHDLSTTDQYADSELSDASYERWRKLGPYAPGLADLYRNQPTYQDPGYNTWRLTRTNPLKTAYEATGTEENGFLGVVNTWFTANMGLIDTKIEWLNSAASGPAAAAWWAENAPTVAQQKELWENSDHFFAVARETTSAQSYANNNLANFKTFLRGNLFNETPMSYDVTLHGDVVVRSERGNIRDFLAAALLDIGGEAYAYTELLADVRDRSEAARNRYRNKWNELISDSDDDGDLLSDLIILFEEIHSESSLVDSNYNIYAKAQLKLEANEDAYDDAFEEWDNNDGQKTLWNSLGNVTDAAYEAFKKTTYKETNSGDRIAVYNAGLDAWSTTRTNGWETYQASEDYEDVSFTRSFQKELDVWTRTKANGLPAYKTSKFLAHDYKQYITEQYLASAAATRDYQTWGARKANGGKIYTQSAQSKEDIKAWRGELYPSQPDYITNKKEWLRTKANGVNDYKVSTELVEDFIEYLDEYNARVTEFYKGQEGVSAEQYQQVCQGNCNVAYNQYQDDESAWNTKFIANYADDYFDTHTTNDLFTRAELSAWQTKVAGLSDTEKKDATWRLFDDKIKTLESQIKQRTKVSYQEWLETNDLTYRQWLTSKLNDEPEYLIDAWKDHLNGRRDYVWEDFVDYAVENQKLIVEKRDIRYWAINTPEGRKVYEKYLKAKVNKEGETAQKEWVKLLNGVIKSGTLTESKNAIGKFKAKYPYWYNYVASGKNESLRPHWEQYLKRTHPEWNTSEKWSNLHPQEFLTWRDNLASNPKRYELWQGSRKYNREYKEFVRTSTNPAVRSKDTLDKYIAHADNAAHFNNWVSISKSHLERYHYFLRSQATRTRIRATYSYDSWLRDDEFSYFDLFLNSLRDKTRIKAPISFDASTRSTRKPAISFNKFSTVSYTLYRLMRELDGGSYQWKTIYQDYYDYLDGKSDRYFKKWIEFLNKLKRNQIPAHVVNQLHRFIKLQHDHSSSTVNDSSYLEWALNKYQATRDSVSDFNTFDGVANRLASYKDWYKKDTRVAQNHIAFLRTRFEGSTGHDALFRRWLRSEATFLHDITDEGALPVGQTKYIAFLRNQYLNHDTYGDSDDRHGDDTALWKKTNLWKRDWNQILLTIDSTKKAKQLMAIEDVIAKDYSWSKNFGFFKSVEALFEYNKWVDPDAKPLTEQDFINSPFGKKELQKLYKILLNPTPTWQAVVDDHKKATSQAYLNYLLHPRQLKQKALRGKAISHSLWLSKHQFEKAEALIKSYKIDERHGVNRNIADLYRRDYIYNTLLWIRQNHKRYRDYVASYDAFVASEKAKDYYLED